MCHLLLSKDPFHCMQVIPSSWLRLFNPLEVNQLLAGGQGGGVDVADLQKHTQYSLGYSASNATIRSFWKVVDGMSVKERQALMKFVTSCSRAPLGGFAFLRPPFVIQKVCLQWKVQSTRTAMRLLTFGLRHVRDVDVSGI